MNSFVIQNLDFINPSFPSYYAGDYPSTQRCLQQWRAACSLLSTREKLCRNVTMRPPAITTQSPTRQT